ncbi:hypothetical protein FT663_02935 [Candidozyma haemuli var. vulneris]|uniref:Major facilitator superfamily (MFS) profile domain-containing protein n=1 Tax=Candidozyma haemuli TaxID=45357 RepID=A0A2V1AWW2_9ASCO|nr:hypothetical protein CXQ85_005363 [[Candida] haemuloni]KAF3987324.1 hypothetical protein FT662_04055 [[Candida] haemuloni var. vulneris]KAF3990969.1 hypothetical protein FT663_02935 [[Candida] haemuloni var. vulneris]PVH22335.1 hypothetical protein CXQ85_005363 [[Candida] haemuloni]
MAEFRSFSVSQETNGLSDIKNVELHDEKSQVTDHKDLDRTSSASSDSDDSMVVIKSFGIRKSELIMEQMTSTWQKVIFCFTIFLGMYIISVENYAISVLSSYATNSYKQHSLMSTIGIIRYVASGAAYPFFARAADIFGRLPLFIVALICKVIGNIVQAKATDVQKYAAGSVFFALGNSGQAILWQLSLCDATSLKWRTFAVGAMSMPTIVNTWSIGEIIAELLANHSWSFGTALWAYTTPLVCLPYILFYLHLIIKARRTETWKQINREEQENFIEGSPRAKRYQLELDGSASTIGKFKGYTKVLFLRLVDNLHAIFWKVDLIGCLLVAVVLGLLLVPLTLAGGTRSQWQRASTIVPLVMGFVAIPIFIFWETKCTKRPLLPWKVMKDRGVWAAFLMSLFTTFVYGMPDDYSYPVLLVGMNASVTVATRTPALKGFLEGLTVPIVGLMLTKVRRTKLFVLFGVAMMFIAMGLFVHFRGDNDGVRAKYYRDGVAIGMCFVGVACGCLLRVGAVSVQACTNHEYMASVIAVFSMSYLVGSALSKSISGAIWTQQMYGVIVEKMTELGVDPSMALSAYSEPYTFIMLAPWGSAPRRAISMAYAELQRKLSIVGVCLCVPLLVWVLLMRDHRLPDTQNFGDLDPSLSDQENAKKAAERDKSQIVFSDDKDYILDFLKRMVGIKPKSPNYE